MISNCKSFLSFLFWLLYSGADPGFQVRGAHIKKLRRAEGGGNFFGRIFRVKSHDFTPKNYIFSNFRGAARPPGSAPGIVCSLLI